MQKYTATSENSMTVSYKVEHTLPYDSEIVLVCFYPREIKSYVYTKMCMQMSIAVLFIIGITWREPNIQLIVLLNEKE